ncbi:uncharacterized protein LOC126335137 [Schistocerca gregaria]|uniref:uncharacterized protein LOC126335137 n=1 Tax=Schistocerca gregaria TaxID=7010 RepID=UPI00211EC349|nr:uncharacterized protein LOC126335137 [Schistocerca gregaria]
MIRQAVSLLLLAGCAVAYPQVTMMFRDHKVYQAEVRCCDGIFNTPHYYRRVFNVSALYLSSHVRRAGTGMMLPEQQDIRVTVTELPSGGFTRTVATASYSQVAAPEQLLRLPISYTTNTASMFMFEIRFDEELTYPQYAPSNAPDAPFYDNVFNLYIVGMDYEYVDV